MREVQKKWKWNTVKCAKWRRGVVAEETEEMNIGGKEEEEEEEEKKEVGK